MPDVHVGQRTVPTRHHIAHEDALVEAPSQVGHHGREADARPERRRRHVRRREMQARGEVPVVSGPGERRLDERRARARSPRCRAAPRSPRCRRRRPARTAASRRPGPTETTPTSFPRGGRSGRRGRRSPARWRARHGPRRGLVTPVGAEHRAAGMEHGLLVDEPVDDVELVGRGHPDLDVGRRRAAAGARSRTATALTRPNPRATHAASIVGSPIGTWTTWSMTPRSRARRRAPRTAPRTSDRVDVSGDGMAVDECSDEAPAGVGPSATSGRAPTRTT